MTSLAYRPIYPKTPKTVYAYLFAHGTFPSAGKHFPFPNIPYPKPSEIVKIDSFLTRERVDAILNLARLRRLLYAA